jgi:hypothetical protein
MGIPLAVPLIFGGLGLAGKYLNRPKDMNYNFRYDPEQVTAGSHNYSADRNFLQTAKTLQGQGVDFLTGRSDMQKGLLDDAYKSSFGFADQMNTQAVEAMSRAGVGGGGPSRAFRAITRAGAGEQYRKSALGIGTQFANLGAGLLQGAAGAYGQMDSTRANVGMFNVGQRNQVNLSNAQSVNNARRYENQMGYEQAVGNANARAAWGDSMSNSMFDLAGLTFGGTKYGANSYDAWQNNWNRARADRSNN